MRRTLPALSLIAVLVMALSASASTRGVGPQASPIKHIVIIFQENHTFDDLLGQLCIAQGGRCDGVDTGTISDGTEIPLQPEPDIVPAVGHNHLDQINAYAAGTMIGWDRVRGCQAPGYACLDQAQAGAVPDLWSLADTYSISDRTFETDFTPSWGSHMELVSTTLDGFVGDSTIVPIESGLGAPLSPPFQRPDVAPQAHQTGCDGTFESYWGARANGGPTLEPSCIPDKDGKGPFKPSPVKYVPTIMDTLDAAGRSWHIYAPGRRGGGYDWSICPTFYECFSTQHDHMRRPADVLQDGKAGTLPDFSIVIPYADNSQHNSFSLIKGDDWIASVVGSIMQGPDWKSTAIFITYDDCGCFYDHVKPPAGAGFRVPMVIVSPYAKPHFVDHNDAQFLSLLTFTEHTFGLMPIPGGHEAGVYDYSDAFNFSQAPLGPITLPLHPVPASSERYVATHPHSLEWDPD